MTRIREGNELKHAYMDAMGEDLGKRYYALLEDVLWLQVNWKHYVTLFGTSENRIELLNQTASDFFGLVESAMWERIILSVTRLLDSPKRTKQQRLTLVALPDLVEPTIRQAVSTHLERVKTNAVFCRDWRNRLLAHRDLEFALGESAKPLTLGSRAQIDELLSAIGDMLNVIHEHYMSS